MTTTISAAIIQAEYKSKETVANLEVIINSAIDTVNSDADQTISYLTGTPGTVDVTGLQASALKPLIALKLASNSVTGGTGSQIAVGGLNSSASINIGGASLNSMLYESAIAKLRSPPIVVANEPFV